MGVRRDGRPVCLVGEPRDSSGPDIRFSNLRWTLWRDLGVDAVDPFHGLAVRLEGPSH